MLESKLWKDKKISGVSGKLDNFSIQLFFEDF